MLQYLPLGCGADDGIPEEVEGCVGETRVNEVLLSSTDRSTAGQHIQAMVV